MAAPRWDSTRDDKAKARPVQRAGLRDVTHPGRSGFPGDRLLRVLGLLAELALLVGVLDDRVESGQRFLGACPHTGQAARRADADPLVLLLVLEHPDEQGNGLRHRLIALAETLRRRGADAGVLVLERLVDVRQRRGGK